MARITFDRGDIFRYNEGIGIAVFSSESLVLPVSKEGKHLPAKRQTEIPKSAVPVNDDELQNFLLALPSETQYALSVVQELMSSSPRNVHVQTT